MRPTSQQFVYLRNFTLLVLRDYKVQHCDGIRWHNVQSFVKIEQLVQRWKWVITFFFYRKAVR